MGEKYIKKEDGKEVVYERDIFGDTKIGELHESWDGTKETRNIFGPNVKVERESFFSDERKSTIDGEKGTFRKGWLDDKPTFGPEKNRGGSGGGSGGGGSGGGGGDCYVATTIYGEGTPQLDIIRKYRDTVLINSHLGRGMIKLYYSGLGKNLAKIIKKIPGTAPLIKKGLDRIVEKYSN